MELLSLESFLANQQTLLFCVQKTIINVFLAENCILHFCEDASWLVRKLQDYRLTAGYIQAVMANILRNIKLVITDILLLPE